MINSLEQLGVSDCGKNGVDIIKNNTQVTSLGFSGDQIINIDILKDFNNIVRLSLVQCDVSDLSALSELENLEELNLLDGNYRINSLKPLFDLKKLTKIYMNLKTFNNISREDLAYFKADPDDGPGLGSIIIVD
jgi:internalin A